jgi:hypothetical protein
MMYTLSETGKPAASRQTLVTESHGITACQGSRPGGLTDRLTELSSVMTTNQSIMPVPDLPQQFVVVTRLTLRHCATSAQGS